MRLSLFALVSVLFFAGTGFCEPKSGRYSDGRAYRVDSQGYQLSDQIAELEVTIKEQENQLSACEDELAGKGKSLPTSNQQLNNETGSVSPQSCSVYTAPLNQQISQLSGELRMKDSVTPESLLKISQLEAENLQLRNRLAVAPKSSQISQLSEESLELRKNLMRKEEESAKLTSTLESSAKKAALQNNDLSAQLSNLKSELDQKKEREAELLASIDKLSLQVANREAPQRAMLSSSVKDLSPVSEEVPTSIESSQRIRSQLGDIQKLVMKRKDIFDSVRAARKGVSIQMQPLLTENGISLDQLRQLATKPSDELTSSRVNLGLGEIRKILISDIQVMERLISRL